VGIIDCLLAVTKPPLQLPRAILFDMDGTLTCPMLDFPKIRAEMGIGDRPILEALADLDESRRSLAQNVLLDHEERASRESNLNPGCAELIAWLIDRSIAIALVTRNSTASTRVVLKRHQLRIDVAITRDDGVFEPSPQPLLLACEKLNIPPQDAWMVGDGQYDIEAGIAAGMTTVWIDHDRPRQFDAAPSVTVRDLPQLHALLREI